jgi:hypothetical protein
MNSFKLGTMILVAIVLTGCKSTHITKAEAFPKMYNERPTSILVVPAINNTTAPESSEYIMTTLSEPLSYHGYYIAPVELVQTIFQQEGILDGVQLENVDPAVYGEQFGVDAVLFVTIDKWQTNYYVFAGNVEVALKYELYSTKTGEKLWFYKDSLKVDTSSNDSGGGIAGLVVDVIATAVKTATTDYVPIAKRVNYMALSSAPVGHYHLRHNRDQQTPSVNKNKVK